MKFEQNTTTKEAELTPEERKNQLYAQRKELIDYGMSQADSQVKEIDAALAELSKTESVTEKFPDVVTSEMFVKKTPETNTTEEWRTPEERFTKTQLRLATKQLAKVKEDMANNPELAAANKKLVELYEKTIAEHTEKLEKINEELKLAV